MGKIYSNLIALVCILLAQTTNLEFMASHTDTHTYRESSARLVCAVWLLFENPFCGNMQLHVMFGPFWLLQKIRFYFVLWQQ